MRHALLPLILCLALALTACKADVPATPAAEPDATAAPTPAPPQAPVADTPAPATDTPAPTPDAPMPSATDPRGVLGGKVWQVVGSGAVEAGTTYAFMDNGDLVVDGPNGTPLTGSWAVATDGSLSMTEEGQTYPTDLVVQDADHVTLRSHNPGGVLEIRLARVMQ